MKAWFLQYKKIIFSLSTFVAVSVGSVLYGMNHLEKTVAVLSKAFLGDPIQIEKIDIQKDKIRFQGISMDLEGSPFLRSPEVEIERLSFAKFGEIKIPEADLYLRRDREGKWNIHRFLEGESSEKIDLKDYKPVTNLPLKSIQFQNVRAHYEDQSLEPNFYKMISLEGRVLFDSQKGISAEAKGIDGAEEYRLRYSGEYMPYDVYLDVVGVSLDSYWKPYLAQEGFVLETGKAEAHLHFYYTGNEGEIKAEIPKIEFLDKKWKDGELYFLLENQEIKMGFDYQENGERKNILAFYDQEKQEAHTEIFDFYYDKIILDLSKKKKWTLAFQTESDLYPKLKGEIDWENQEEKLAFQLKSNLLKTKGEYEKNKKILHLFEKNQFSILYDVEKQNLQEGKGKIPFSLYDYQGEIHFQGENNLVEFSSIQIHSEKKGFLEAKGSLDLHTKTLDLDYQSDHFLWEQKISDKDVLAKLALAGKIHYAQEDGIRASSQGEIEKIQFGDYVLDGLRADVEYQENVLKVYALENRFLSAEGQLDFLKQNSDLDVSVRDFESELLKIEYPKFRIGEANAKLTGKMQNPMVSIRLEEGSIFLLKEKENKVRGQATIEDKVLFLEDLEVDHNRVSGEYHFDDNSYRIKANIIEEKLSYYYGFHDLYYRAIGEVFAEGKGRVLEVDINSTLDKIYYQGRKLPNISWEGKYSLGESGLGSIHFPRVEIQNRKEKKLLSLTGDLDLDSEEISVDLEKQDLSLEEIKEYSQIDFLTGILSLEGKVRGTYRKPNYQIKVDGKELKIKEEALDYFSAELEGNEQSITVNKMQTAYLKNKIEISGYYNFNGKYDLAIKAPDIHWNLFQDLVSDYGVRQLQGKSDLDLHLRNENSQGKFQLQNLSFSLPEKYIDVKNISGNIHFLGEEMKIEKISGKLNQGEVSLKGKVDLPELNKIGEDLNFLQDLSYTLDFHAEEVEYKIPKELSLTLSSNLRLKENKLRGNIELIRGLVEDVPNAYQSYWQILKDFFFKQNATATVLPSEEVGKDEPAIATQLEKLLDIDLGLWIREGIKLNIPSLNVAVEEVHGNVIGGVNVIGKQGKYALLGNIEVEQGSLMVNTNTFVLDKALLSFNDAKVYLPEVQPTLLVDSSVEVNGDKVRFGLQGKMDELRFSISSRDGNTSGSLNSLLTGEIEGSGENASCTALLQNLIGGQLTQTVVGPITKWIRKAFHVEKFRVTSNVYKQSGNKNANSEGNLAVGAKIEVRDNLYKDKLYWNFTGNLYDSGVQTTQGQKNKDNKIMDEYDLSLQYPYSKTKTFEIGVGKLPSKFYNGREVQKDKKLNYHIGVKIEKKMDNFFDIFKE